MLRGLIFWCGALLPCVAAVHCYAEEDGFSPPSVVLSESVTDEAQAPLQRLEEIFHRQLIDAQRSAAKIAPFVSDGCSGGLSDAWRILSQWVPELVDGGEDYPPWQQCCVEHDRAYWQGSGEHGYARRLAADQQLRQCVLDSRHDSQRLMVPLTESRPVVGTAPIKSAPLGPDLLSPQLDRLYPLIADMIYQAVRLGGMPCSGLSWRWGYGWPHCGSARSRPQTVGKPVAQQ